MTLRDLSSYLEDDGLEYPLPASAFTVEAGAEPRFPDGKTYLVPSPDAKTGLWLTALADVGLRVTQGADVSEGDKARLKLDDDDEKTLYQRALGPVYEQMLADGVKWSWLQQIGQDAYLSFTMGPQAADAALVAMASSGKPAARENRAARRRTARKTAGSKSNPVSGGIPVPTRDQVSTPSSTSPTGPEATAV